MVIHLTTPPTNGDNESVVPTFNSEDISEVMQMYHFWMAYSLPTICTKKYWYKSIKKFGYAPINTSLLNEDESNTSNIDDTPECTDAKETNLLVEVDTYSLEEYNYAKSFIFIAYITITFLWVRSFMFHGNILLNFYYFGCFCFGAAPTCIHLVPCPSLIRFLRRMTKPTPLVHLDTILTQKGIRHVQSECTSEEVFILIPYEDVENICILNDSIFGFAVTVVMIKTQKRMKDYAVSGCPTSESAFWWTITYRLTKHVILLFGLTDPASFQRIVRERKRELV